MCEFRGRVTDSELEELYRGAKAVVVPTIEEFGIVAVEGQAAGRPVIAPREGGASETVIPGETGVLLETRSAETFAEAMRTVNFARFTPEACRASAARFAPEVFRARLHALIDQLVGI